MLRIKNLTVSYDNKIALNGISAEFHSAKITGLIGPNGAGKSTLLKTCIGLIENYSGAIYFDNKLATSYRYWVKENAAYAPENAELFPYLTGFEFLQLIAKIHKLPDISTKISFYSELLGLQIKINDLIISYSHGMKQKLAVAAVLLADVKFIMLDESLNGLDSISLGKVFEHLKVLREKGRLILITSHNVGLIYKWCDVVFVINNGSVTASFTKKDLAEIRCTEDDFLKKYMDLINE
jgi:ABC-2 type transport system ATP-binding protein